MAREEHRLVQQSVLDRLMDRDHGAADEAISRAQSVRMLKAAVRRDLEWLLNTRSVAVPPPEGLRELKASLYTYGLGDITSLSADDPKARARLRSMIEQSIATFEPRLSAVQVQEKGTPNGEARQIRFMIQALLKMDPTPERVTFDTVLDLASGEYLIQGDSGAR
ncbi:MAG TPA: type VI secretion system baseplate subunit TssE [Bryobacteraceae bacterium]|jgi:type VI secretion system protein ImpF|nr:type VI secretion system baseplate subunit TssE [Bryobacteraceae bacterium]